MLRTLSIYHLEIQLQNAHSTVEGQARSVDNSFLLKALGSSLEVEKGGAGINTRTLHLRKNIVRTFCSCAYMICVCVRARIHVSWRACGSQGSNFRTRFSLFTLGSQNQTPVAKLAWPSTFRRAPQYEFCVPSSFQPEFCCIEQNPNQICPRKGLQTTPKDADPHSVHRSLSHFIRWLLCSQALILQSKHERSIERSHMPAEFTSS